MVKIAHIAVTILTVLIDCFVAGAADKTAATKSQDENFVSGIENYIMYCPQNDGENSSAKLSFAIGGSSFEALAFYYQKGSCVSVNDLASGQKTLLIENGRIFQSAGSKANYPNIGTASDGSLKTTEYVIGSHDFTGDNSPEILIAIRDKSGDGFIVNVMKYSGDGWTVIGQMAAVGKGITSCRVFRQTVSFKDSASSVMHTWTYHNGAFDYLASNHGTDPTVLFK
ncbi:MAG: hypothetical protein WCR48_03850 [Bacteroidales bacterium]